MQVITPILIIIIVLVAIFFLTSVQETTEQTQKSLPITGTQLIDYLKVIKCAGGNECSIEKYNKEASDITGQVVLPAQARKSHVIGKSQTGDAVISDTTQNKMIKNVFLQFRYFGENGIDGNWAVQFKNDALTETYCIYALSLSERVIYNEIDITNCNWNKNKLDDLTIQLTNGDTGTSQEAFVSAIALKVIYS